jgi:hypothetical protein
LRSEAVDKSADQFRVQRRVGRVSLDVKEELDAQARTFLHPFRRPLEHGSPLEDCEAGHQHLRLGGAD